MNARSDLKRNEIGIDLDNPSQIRLLRAYLMAKNIGDVLILRTGLKGDHHYHIRIKLNREISLESNIEIRRFLGDDESRLKWDERRLRIPKLRSWIDTVFNLKGISMRRRYGKRKIKVVSVEEYGYYPLSLPFFSQIPRGWYVWNSK